MVKITNLEIYELWESIIACRNAMRTEPAKRLCYDKDIVSAKGTKAEAVEIWGNFVR